MDEFNVGGGGGMGGMSGAPPPEEDFSKMPIEERLKSKVRNQCSRHLEVRDHAVVARLIAACMLTNPPHL